MLQRQSQPGAVDGGGLGALVSFAAPWTSPFHVDPTYPYSLVNGEGEHLFILNKTAWTYFRCQEPTGVVARATAQGVNVLRVGLETNVYEDVLHQDCWPWGGTRDHPDWTTFDEAYWEQVEARIRLAGAAGLGLDLVLYGALRPTADALAAHRRYWARTLARLGKYANILTWEIANEYLGNPEFQDAAGSYFHAHDPYHRPVCTSAGTTDDAAWPDKPWVDLAINHSCTSSTAAHPLDRWYLAVARNTRAHGKPAFCNESGRERRHRNDDGIARRKQGWLWCAAGGYWTYHAWEGCEGIDDAAYRGPGQEFLRPMGETFRALPHWRMAPNHTAATTPDAHVIAATLAAADRQAVLVYLCTPATGDKVAGLSLDLLLPAGAYRLRLVRPSDGAVIGERRHASPGLANRQPVALPPFTDDLALVLTQQQAGAATVIPGTE